MGLPYYVNWGITTWTLTVKGAIYKAEVTATVPVDELIDVDIPAKSGFKSGAIEHLNVKVTPSYVDHEDDANTGGSRFNVIFRYNKLRKGTHLPAEDGRSSEPSLPNE